MKRTWMFAVLLAVGTGLASIAPAEAQRDDGRERSARGYVRMRAGDRDQRREEWEERREEWEEQREEWEERREEAREREREADERRREEEEEEEEERREEAGEREREADERRREEWEERREEWEERREDEYSQRGSYPGRTRGRWDGNGDGRWDGEADWRDVVDGLFRGDARRGRYQFRLPGGFDLDFQVREPSRDRDYYDDPGWRDGHWRDGRWHAPRRSYPPHEQLPLRSVPYYLARTADQLLAEVRRADFRRDEREITERAERFARSADRFYERFQRIGAFSRSAFREVTDRWRDLDRDLSRVSPHRHEEVLELARRADRLWSRLDRYIGN